MWLQETTDERNEFNSEGISVYNTAPPDLSLIYNVYVRVCVCVGKSNSWRNFGNVWELVLVLVLLVFVFFRFVFVVRLCCLVLKFVLSYALQKCMEKNDLGYFEECHTVGEGGVMSDRCVGRGARRWIHARWIQVLSPFSFSTWLIMSFVFTIVNSPIQGRCNTWAMVDCGRWIKTLSLTCIGSL